VFFLRSTSLFAFEDLMFETACVVAFFGFLRCGEFTVNGVFDPTVHLCVNDMVISHDCILLTLKQSKTDPFREGITIRLFKLDTVICPYNLCYRYMQARLRLSSSSYGPLFVIQHRGILTALTRSTFISKLKHILECVGLNSKAYNGHSFRIGAATTGGSVHLQDSVIKLLGRWSSDAYCTYIRTPLCTIKEAQVALANF